MIIACDMLLTVILMTVGYVSICLYLNTNNKKSQDIFKLNVNRIIYIISIIVASAVLIVVFQKVYKLSLIHQLRLLSLVLIIFPISAIDYKIKKIPNIFIIEAIIVRIIFYIVEFISNRKLAIDTLKNDLIGAFLIAGFFLIVALVVKNSIGMGDIKLFWVMGLYQGLWGVVNSVFFSLFASFLVSVFLLISKKKNKKDTIAFAPCILLGTITAIALAGM